MRKYSVAMVRTLQSVNVYLKYYFKRIGKNIFKLSYSNIIGGLSPDLQSMEQIRRIMRPTDVPDQGLLCDLLWSDPDKVSSIYKKQVI